MDSSFLCIKVNTEDTLSLRLRSDVRAMITLTFILGFVSLAIAGQGGLVFLINLSGSDWKLTRRESRIMNDWNFPSLVKNGDTAQVYVEFKYNPKSENAIADYELVGTGGKKFQITAQVNPRQLNVVYTNMKIDGQPKGMRRNLRWKHNGETSFILIGKNGKYTGTHMDGSNWMKNNMDVLGMRTLKEMCIPGSHESSMNQLDGHTAFGRSCNVLTQTHTIGDQLKIGMRYFDIRPVIGNGGKFLTGHYTYLKHMGHWHGGNGQSISSIIEDLNGFTKDHKELIIIKLSHSFNTDLGYKNFRKLNQQEWEMLFKELDKIKKLYNNNNSDINLEEIKLSQYTNNGTKACVVLIIDDEEPGVDLGSRMGKGYFLPRNLDIYGEESDTSDWSKMVEDQIEKMDEHSEERYFLLHWTLTQNNFQAFFCIPSVKDLADEANSHIGRSLYKDISSTTYPNIILFNNVKCTGIASMAMAINMKIRSKANALTIY